MPACLVRSRFSSRVAFSRVALDTSGAWSSFENVEASAGALSAIVHLACAQVDGQLQVVVDTGALLVDVVRYVGGAWGTFTNALIPSPGANASRAALAVTGVAYAPVLEIEIAWPVAEGETQGAVEGVEAGIQSIPSGSATAQVLANAQTMARTVGMGPFGPHWRLGVFYNSEGPGTTNAVLEDYAATSAATDVSTFGDGAIHATIRIPPESIDAVLAEQFNPPTPVARTLGGNTVLTTTIEQPTAAYHASPPSIRFDATIHCSVAGGASFDATGHQSVNFAVTTQTTGLGAAQSQQPLVQVSQSSVSLDIPAWIDGAAWLTVGIVQVEADLVSVLDIAVHEYSPSNPLTVAELIGQLFVPKFYVSGGTKVPISYTNVVCDALGVAANATITAPISRTPAIVWDPANVVYAIEEDVYLVSVSAQIDDFMSPTATCTADGLVLQGQVVPTPGFANLQYVIPLSFTSVPGAATPDVIGTVHLTVTDQDGQNGPVSITSSVPIFAPKVGPPPRPIRGQV